MNGKNKKIIVVTIIVLAIIAGGVGGYFAYQSIEENNTTGTDWGDTYYKVLSSTAESVQGKNDDVPIIESGGENTTVQFIEVKEDESPYMIVSYTINDNPNINVCKLTDSNDANSIITELCVNADIEYLYNISFDQYIWYIHYVEETNQSDIYVPISTIMEEAKNNSETDDNEVARDLTGENEPEDETKTYVIKRESETSVETTEGETLSISEFDQTFIEPEVEKSTQKEVDLKNMSEEEIKKIVSEAVLGYKSENDMITEDIKTSIEETVETVNAKLAEIQEAKEMEEEMKGVSIENYTLKYGSYRSELGAGVITIKSDGTFSYTGNYLFDLTATLTVNGTYTVEPNTYFIEGKKTSEECIIFEYNGKKEYFYSKANNRFQDQEDIYNYQND